jgi:hypothetical protein
MMIKVVVVRSKRGDEKKFYQRLGPELKLSAAALAAMKVTVKLDSKRPDDTCGVSQTARWRLALIERGG